MSESKAIRKLKAMLDAESPASLAGKLGIARGTLFALLSGRTEPRLGVMVAAKKLGIKQEEWSC